jgi:hypothetical protein
MEPTDAVVIAYGVRKLCSRAKRLFSKSQPLALRKSHRWPRTGAPTLQAFRQTEREPSSGELPPVACSARTASWDQSYGRPATFDSLPKRT